MPYAVQPVKPTNETNGSEEMAAVEAQEQEQPEPTVPEDVVMISDAAYQDESVAARRREQIEIQQNQAMEQMRAMRFKLGRMPL